MNASGFHSSFPSRIALTALVAALGGTGLDAGAARIPEPPTVVYGRVVYRGAAREAVFHQGTLVWTLRGSVPKPWTREVRATLGSVAGGTYSYRMEIPHDLLTLDLVPSTGSVPLTAAPSAITLGTVTFEGRPASVLAPATRLFAVQQATRASSLRLDVEVSEGFDDSDGDGDPDVWELQEGRDPWNPGDADAPVLSGPGTSGPAGGGSGSDSPVPGAGLEPGLAAWRTREFPGDVTDLDAFAAADPDGDGVPNLVEYAFDLDPKRPDDAARLERLPQARLRDGRVVVEMETRPGKSDLEFAIEASSDLRAWAPVEGVGLEGADLNPASPTRRMLASESAPPASAGVRFVRVRVSRRP